MDNLGLKEAKELVEKYELLEISLQDISQQLRNNIEYTKHLQKNGLELDKIQIEQIIKEINSKNEKTSSILKALIFINIGFLAGILFAILFLN